jgi:hypothetical protein
MSEHRVEELCLRLRAPEGRERELRAAAERFARTVLGRVADRLEARAPGRLLLVRRLPLRWRLDETALEDPAAEARCADDLAAALEDAAAGAGAPAPDDDVAVFEDEAHWRASHLLARARGGAGAWFHEALEAEGDALDALCAPGKGDLTVAVVARLAADGTLVEVLSALPAAKLVALARALGLPEEVEGRPGDHPGERGLESGPSPLPGPAAEALVRFALGLPATLARQEAVLALYVQARRHLGRRASDTEVRAAAALALAALGSAGPAPGPAGVPAPASPGPARGAPAETETLFGGLFYLLTCALELGVGEMLWRACLPEGEVLAHAAAALLGPAGAGDPAPALFGGVAPALPFPPVSPEQQEEVSAALLAALAAALPRRGPASLPETVLGFAAHPTGRQLVAAIPDSPFAIFAWPAASPHAVEAGVRAFLDAWPVGAPPPRGLPALAELDPSVRVRPARGPGLSPALLLPAAPSSHAAALLAQTAGSLGQLFVSRAGSPALPSAADFVQHYLALPGRVDLAPETMTVTLSLEGIDLAVRRAGLDRDPGWVPWLGRFVRLVFAGPEQDA